MDSHTYRRSLKLGATFTAVALFLAGVASGQSTFGSFLGTVHDPSGSVIGNCVVKVTNTGTSATRTIVTDQSGSYVLVNLEPGLYEITMEAPGFERATYLNLNLQARQTIRVDGNMTLGNAGTSGQRGRVGASHHNGCIQSGRDENGKRIKRSAGCDRLPSRGSTSAITTLTTQAGVLTDNSGNLSVAGSKPAMLSMSIDGISTMSPRSYVPIAELFPSFNGIAEIRVSEVNNAAEYGGISDITTISKGGTNAFHGGMFENNQAADYDARSPFSAVKAKLVMNDFGGFAGGPVSIPKLYNGRNRTFFF